MSYKIIYLEKAKLEYNAAIEWYAAHNEKASINFEIAINNKIEILRNNPEFFKNVYKKFHEVSVARYPYSIVYQINNENKYVIIFSIFHHKRNPKLKYRK